MTYGRPSMLPGRSEVDYPAIIDDEFLRSSGEGSQPSELPSRMICFAYSIKLTDILEEVLLGFYHQEDPENYSGACSEQTLSTILHIDAKLHEFKKTIPGVLRPDHQRYHRGAPWHSCILLQASLLDNLYVLSRL
jgi:hypothetical protein